MLEQVPVLVLVLVLVMVLALYWSWTSTGGDGDAGGSGGAGDLDSARDGGELGPEHVPYLGVGEHVHHLGHHGLTPSIASSLSFLHHILFTLCPPTPSPPALIRVKLDWVRLVKLVRLVRLG